MESEQELDDFTDQEEISDYAAEALRWAVERGLILGYEDQSVRPQNELTRGELAALMHRYQQYLIAEEPEYSDEEYQDTDKSTDPTQPGDTDENMASTEPVEEQQEESSV